MAANLYAKSIFGEDALANVSLEKNLGKADAPVTGHIRLFSHFLFGISVFILHRKLLMVSN